MKDTRNEEQEKGKRKKTICGVDGGGTESE
jgi:hypothetical protein